MGSVGYGKCGFSRGIANKIALGPRGLRNGEEAKDMVVDGASVVSCQLIVEHLAMGNGLFLELNLPPTTSFPSASCLAFHRHCCWLCSNVHYWAFLAANTCIFS